MTLQNLKHFCLHACRHPRVNSVADDVVELAEIISDVQNIHVLALDVRQAKLVEFFQPSEV
jgi:hypothetical protein